MNTIRWTNRAVVTRAMSICLLAALPVGAAEPPAISSDSGQATPAAMADDLFIYRGQLAYRDEALNGVVTLEFQLYADESDTYPIAPAVFADEWPVVEGRVWVGLDFGEEVELEQGAWLEVTVDGTVLSPRQYIAPKGWSLSGDVSRDRRRAVHVVDFDDIQETASGESSDSIANEAQDAERNAGDPAGADVHRARSLGGLPSSAPAMNDGANEEHEWGRQGINQRNGGRSGESLTGGNADLLFSFGDRFFNSTNSVFVNIDTNDDDSDTRIFEIAKDRSGDIGGTSLFRVGEDGNVGIGTSDPVTNLHVFGGQAVLRLDGDAADSFSEFKDATSQQLRINKNHTGPVLMDLNPKADDGVSSADIRFFRETNTTGLKRVQFLRGDFTTSASAQIGVDGADSFFQMHGGNVGIGLVPTEARLQVDGPIQSEGSGGGSIAVKNPNNQLASASLSWLNDTARIRIGGNGAGASGGLDIQRSGNLSLMRILHNGNVGIGDSSPSARLEVFKNESNAEAGITSTNAGTGAAGVFKITNSANSTTALYGSTTGSGVAVFGDHGSSGIGVYGTGTYGVYGFSEGGRGVYGLSQAEEGYGVFGRATGGAQSAGIYATNSGSGWGGLFFGPTVVDGNFFVSNGTKYFLIDNPLNPSEEYLFHSCVESDEMKNVYDGMVVLDESGSAEVTLPDWFDRVNGSFRYQLTCVGGHAPVYVANEIENNRFRIAGGCAGLKISWQVTGVRIDPAALAADFQVIRRKPEADRGTYLTPAGYGQPESAKVKQMTNPMTAR